MIAWFKAICLQFLFSLQLNQQCEDRSVLRYVYYYLARILSDTGAQGVTTGGGIPTPNWDALADIDAVGGVTRADVVPRIVNQLTTEASNADAECNVIFQITKTLLGFFLFSTSHDCLTLQQFIVLCVENSLHKVQVYMVFETAKGVRSELV